MKRNLVTTLKFAKGYIRVVCIEKISADLVELFNNTLWSCNVLQQKNFIIKSISSINKIIGGKLESIVVILENNKATNLEIKMIEKEILISSSYVTKDDINNVIELAKKQYKNKNNTIILAQPIKFTIKDIVEKYYNRAPLNKKGELLKVKLAISSVDIRIINYVKKVAENTGLIVSQILTETHSIAQATISNSALSTGAISLNIGIRRTIISVNVNAASITSLEIPLGYKHLINEVSESFFCTKETVANLLNVYGKLIIDSEYIIFTPKNRIKNISFTNKDLNIMVIKFISKIARDLQTYIYKFKKLKNLAIVVSGEIKNFIGIQKFFSKFFTTKYIKIYKPLLYVASNEKNIETIGAINFIERFDKVIGKDFHTIVMTNPNSISSIIKNKKTNIFIKFLNKIGGQYVSK